MATEVIPVPTQVDVRTSVWAAVLASGVDAATIAAIVQPENRDRVAAEHAAHAR